MAISVRETLANQKIEASAPCRIDAGGTWDIKALALPLAAIEPVTVNFALDLRTWVTLEPYQEGRVSISSEGFPRRVDHPADRAPFHSDFGLFFAAISHFGFHGLRVKIRSDSPVKSALGGSSTALIALIKALSRLSALLGRERVSAGEMLHLGYHLEDGVGGGNCGIQDQAAAIYGGANLWTWQFARPGLPFKREKLLAGPGRQALSERLLVAYSGQSHVSIHINRGWIADFLAGKTREGWIEANQIIKGFAEAVRRRDWDRAADCIRKEMAIRRRITPQALIAVTKKLVCQAEEIGCGARFAGAGAGGSVWAIGETDRIGRLKKEWSETLARIKTARILPCRIDPRGAR